MEDRYTVMVIRDYFPEYAVIKGLMFEIQDIITSSRTKGLGGRHELYDEIHGKHLPCAVPLYRKLVLSEDLIEKDIKQAKERADKERAEAEQNLKRERERHKKNQRITWAIAIISVVIAAASLTVAILMYLLRLGQGAS